jgi:hypothetical protein
LLENTFEQSNKEDYCISFKYGISESMFVDADLQYLEMKDDAKQERKYEEEDEELPRFLMDDSVEASIEE